MVQKDSFESNAALTTNPKYGRGFDTQASLHSQSSNQDNIMFMTEKLARNQYRVPQRGRVPPELKETELLLLQIKSLAASLGMDLYGNPLRKPAQISMPLDN